ncbi:Major Facilitator Superfamily protein [Marinospirillum celere]|uniref:Major Facilitator Superfamily protein n=2 Tax=Marinospirillum celere TaxID=1122252 RepID=A0A1I1EKB9_9GAMM|nr:Major Facilitator Superfamily protein [Marinospirillum celere]
MKRFEDSMTSPNNKHPDWAESLYERLAEDDEGRVCKDISDEACQETPGNFLYTLIANTLSSLADKLASAKTTLPWLLLHLGGPSWMLSLLVPIRESGSMLPQMLIGALVRRQAIRKWVWVWGGGLQGSCLLLMGWVALVLEGALAGYSLLGLLILFSLARGACSVAFKDVQGKTIPKTRRGRLGGWISALSGGVTLAIGLLLGMLQNQDSSWFYAGLLLLASACWFLAALVFSRIVEFPGATEGGANGLTEAFKKLNLLKDDRLFRKFVVARALAMGSGLAAPFYLALARDDLGGALVLLGLFIAVEGLAGLISSPIWGRWADQSSRKVFSNASALAGGLSLLVALVSLLSLPSSLTWGLYLLCFLGLGIAHAGVRLGRKTYMVDMAGGNKRTDYVAVSNSVIGALLLLTGLLGALTALFSVQATLILLGSAGLASALISRNWKEVSG